MRVAAIAGAGEVSVSRTGKDLEVAAVIRFKVFPANGALSRSNGERATLTNLGVDAYRFSSPRQVSFVGSIGNQPTKQPGWQVHPEYRDPITARSRTPTRYQRSTPLTCINASRAGTRRSPRAGALA